MDNKQEYSRLLAECLYILRSERTEKEYKRAILRANKFLSDINSIVTDAERLLDPVGRLRPDARMIIGEYGVLEAMMLEAGRLKSELISQGGEVRSLELATAISAASSMEQKIIDEYGRAWGEIIIYEALTATLPLEDELGVSLYRERTEREKSRLSVKLLYPIARPIEIGKEDLDEDVIPLENSFGDTYTAKRWARIYEGGEYYLELELLGVEASGFGYYRLSRIDEKQCLVRVEDKERIQALDARRDEIEIASRG